MESHLRLVVAKSQLPGVWPIPSHGVLVFSGWCLSECDTSEMFNLLLDLGGLVPPNVTTGLVDGTVKRRQWSDACGRCIRWDLWPPPSSDGAPRRVARWGAMARERGAKRSERRGPSEVSDQITFHYIIPFQNPQNTPGKPKPSQGSPQKPRDKCLIRQVKGLGSAGRTL